MHWEDDTESLHEAEALDAWSGNGAVRLLRRGERAMLEERAVPGTDISGLPEQEATAIAVVTAARLWQPVRRAVPARCGRDPRLARRVPE